MFQTKEQGKTQEKELNEKEITNLVDKDFNITVIIMLTDLWKVQMISGRTATKRRFEKEPLRAEEYSN